ncbi:alpha/beta hydrolase [Trichoderma parareesei]|uniref:Alpha/beta hydrolase n=1 Tax=Trichoderma parareesei TaxID=858221 RepID=A0A2H2ZQD5_TRIPA|nr:alpha/beta hydrolase [Trichoderma parareesei]
MWSLAVAAELLLLAGTASAILFQDLRPPKPDVDVDNNNFRIAAAASTPTYGTFQQLIDHNHPELGTFSQRYVWNDEFYAGPGSPIILMGPNESALDGYERYTTNLTLPGVMAQELGAGALIIEHRYWGQSSPFDSLTTENMRYLTLEQSVQDLVYFAQNVALPFDQNRTSTPDKAPWVLVGCSYSGALAAWVQDLAPGTFWAYQCSSPVVEAIGPLWKYFEQVKLAMPQNCTADYARIVQYIDGVLLGHNQKAKDELKASFNLGDVEHDDDFAAALVSGLYTWQSVLFSDGYSATNRMCDYVENQWPGSTAPAPGKNGVGLTKALAGYAKWFTTLSLPGSCASYGYWTNPNDTSCYDTYNASSPLFTDLSPENTGNRQWWWFLCNEPFKWWQVRGLGNLVSRLVNQPYFERQCGLIFPRKGKYTYGIAQGATTARVNRVTGGWYNVNTHRLAWTAGEFDPWRPATVMAVDRPGGPLRSTKQHPVWVVPGAAHCGDMLVRNRNANEGVRNVFDSEVANIKQWVQEFYEQKGKKGN